MHTVIIFQAQSGNVSDITRALGISLGHEEGYFQAGRVSFDCGQNTPFEAGLAIRTENQCYNGVGYTCFFDGNKFMAIGDLLEISNIIDDLPEHFINNIKVVEYC